ncbi:MAG: aldehyde dehydrogenase family protein [Actinomycetota bacterium]|nr:aldehyde dehydrogenase family protein [Actinomycetota bacterium]
MTTLDVHDPCTGELVGSVPIGTPPQVDQAVQAACSAAPSWARTSPADRADLLKQAGRRLREEVDALAELQSREGGKPIGDSRGGVLAGLAALEQYAELGPLHRGYALQGGWHSTDVMSWEPRGVCAVLTPWNDPVAIALQAISAALVVGNTVVFKPSERTPLSGQRIAELLCEVLPPDVLQVLHGGRRTGAPLAAHPDVDVVYFVGSSDTARSIAAGCAQSGAHAVLEGGGKDPCLVDAGVDPVWAAGQVALGAFANVGQICTSVERVYVHEQLAPAFLDALVAEAGERVLGSWDDPDTTMGPMVDRRQRAVVDGQVRGALAAGAELLAGGQVPDGSGAFYPPTVLTGCTEDMAVMSQETFGPVAAVQVVDSFDAALHCASRSTYGLAATVLSADLGHVQRAVRELPVGTVKVNAVFGGAPGGAAHPGRGSGHGLGYGPELLDELSRVKVVHWEPAPTG